MENVIDPKKSGMRDKACIMDGKKLKAEN